MKGLKARKPLCYAILRVPTECTFALKEVIADFAGLHIQFNKQHIHTVTVIQSNPSWPSFKRYPEKRKRKETRIVSLALSL